MLSQRNNFISKQFVSNLLKVGKDRAAPLFVEGPEYLLHISDLHSYTGWLESPLIFRGQSKRRKLGTDWLRAIATP